MRIISEVGVIELTFCVLMREEMNVSECSYRWLFYHPTCPPNAAEAEGDPRDV